MALPVRSGEKPVELPDYLSTPEGRFAYALRNVFAARGQAPDTDDFNPHAERVGEVEKFAPDIFAFLVSNADFDGEGAANFIVGLNESEGSSFVDFLASRYNID